MSGHMSRSRTPLGETDTATPIPPPLPPPQRREKPSVALKVREAPPGWAFEGHIESHHWDQITPPAGLYFFYGTLQDPEMLREILDLSESPAVTPASIMGYQIRLWGQYPALIDKPGNLVHGSAFHVPDEDSAAKLAAYETNNYWPAPCDIDLGEKEERRGYVFKFCGNRNDLSDGEFDLDRWLQLMGRKTRH